MPDHLAVPKQEPSARSRTEIAVRLAEDKRLEGNQGQSRLERHRLLLEGAPRLAQLKAQAVRLDHRPGTPTSAPRQGHVRPTIQARSLPINDDSGLEREADAMGRQSLYLGERSTAPAERLRPPALPAVSASQGTVQRKIFIEGKEAQEEAEVQAFFAKHGIHYYYSYREALLTLLGGGGRRNLDGRGDAVELAQALAIPEEEAQAGVQRKLVEISEMFRTKVEGRGPIPEAYDRWYGEMILNGLCYGFVTVFEAHPDWTLGMWQALESWVPRRGVSVDEALDQLNAHIEAHMHFADDLTGQNFLEAVLLAREAWDHMKEEDDYGDVPPAVDAVTGTESDHSSESIREGEVDEKFAVSAEQSAPERWQRIRNYIAGEIGPTGSYHIIVWHESHEMAVRCVLEEGELRQLIAVETESEGMKACRDWGEVGNILGPWLMTEGIDEIGVDIRKQEPRI